MGHDGIDSLNINLDSPCKERVGRNTKGNEDKSEVEALVPKTMTYSEALVNNKSNEEEKA